MSGPAGERDAAHRRATDAAKWATVTVAETIVEGLHPLLSDLTKAKRNVAMVEAKIAAGRAEVLRLAETARDVSMSPFQALERFDRESGIAFSDRPAPESFDQEPAVAWSLFAERLANTAHATLNGEPMVGAAAHKEAA